MNNLTIFDAEVKYKSIFKKYTRIAISISGGSDSDLLIDMTERLKLNHNQIFYVFFDTGLEMKATKDHIKYLEKRYKIKIEIKKAKKPIPVAVRERGYPFINKRVSEMIYRLQRKNFDFQTANNFSFEEQIIKYPKCSSALKWFYNKYPKMKSKEGIEFPNLFNIEWNKNLREFLIENPPEFKISSKCCDYVKKKPAEEFNNKHNIELSVIGLRKAEGGARSVISNCFNNKKNPHQFYPVFWFKNEDKKEYNIMYNIVNSKAYSIYGFERTGCAGCPLSITYKEDINRLNEHEKLLSKAVSNIWGESQKYKQLYENGKKTYKEKNQLKLF